MHRRRGRRLRGPELLLATAASGRRKGAHATLDGGGRPAAPHAVATPVLMNELGPPFWKGRGGPGGWIVLVEPELHLGADADVLVPDLVDWRRETMSAVPRCSVSPRASPSPPPRANSRSSTSSSCRDGAGEGGWQSERSRESGSSGRQVGDKSSSVFKRWGIRRRRSPSGLPGVACKWAAPTLNREYDETVVRIAVRVLKRRRAQHESTSPNSYDRI